ncbi:MAG: hypothetical protein KKA67_07495 [Spirochaetes bacterium]|nr:hypothetical protein [Spirochaetota bacterium]
MIDATDLPPARRLADVARASDRIVVAMAFARSPASVRETLLKAMSPRTGRWFAAAWKNEDFWSEGQALFFRRNPGEFLVDAARLAAWAEAEFLSAARDARGDERIT